MATGLSWRAGYYSPRSEAEWDDGDTYPRSAAERGGVRRWQAANGQPVTYTPDLPEPVAGGVERRPAAGYSCSSKAPTGVSGSSFK